MKDFTARSKVYPTPYLYDKIFTLSPEFTWDINTFVLLPARSLIKSENRNSGARPPARIRTLASQNRPKCI